MTAVDHAVERLPSDKRILSNGTDFLLWNIVDDMVDGQAPPFCDLALD